MVSGAGGIGRLAAVGAVVVALSGCSSARFGGAGLAPAAPTRQARVTSPPVDPAPVEALPSGSVSSEPLPPPPGASAASAPVVLADVPTMPGSPRPIETLAPAAVTPYVPAGSSGRSAQVGGWTARDATGASCRVSLSSSPSLDLYKASTSGCGNKDLGRVTAWDFRDGEVYLYQPGGAVAARLKGEAGSLSGVLAKSGAPLTLTR